MQTAKTLPIDNYKLVFVEDGEVDPGTWEINGEELSLNLDDGDSKICYHYEVSDDFKTFKCNIEEDFATSIYVFNKVQ